MRRLAIGAFILECLAFGVGVLLYPAFLVETLNDAEPIAYGWVRWAGADLLAMGVGALLMLRKGGAGIVRLMATISTVGAIVAFIWSAAADEWDGATWFLVAVIAVNALILFGLWAPERDTVDVTSSDTEAISDRQTRL